MKKVHRVNDRIKQKNRSSHVATLHIPKMSETALKRWREARDTYLGDRYTYKQSPRRVKKKHPTTKHPEPAPFFTLENERFSTVDLQHVSLDETLHEHLDDKCVGTETDESIFFNTDIEQMDEAIQADLPSPELELQLENDPNIVEDVMKQEIQSGQESIEYNDKATETDLILDIQKEDKVDRQNIKETIIDSIPNVSDQIEPINDDDRKTILSSNEPNTSIYEQFQRLRQRFKRTSKERRLLSCLLVLYIIIMFGLLVVLFMLLWAFQERSLILNREIKMIDTGIIDGVARYGESCNNDNDCKRPFTCFKKRSSSSGSCRCPLKYDFVNNQCIGDLNALCTKDSDCQRYMLCSGMEDGTRRCHCQTLYNYDNERQQCRGDYQAPCQNHFDCRANLICNKTIIPSLCLCQVNYRYYPLVHKCRGDPGAICEQATAECVDNAECRDGACECAFQFVPNEKKICVDPCPRTALNRVKIRYPGNCRRFIDCQQRTKSECPEMTIFNFRTQLCDYPKNVLDCR